MLTRNPVQVSWVGILTGLDLVLQQQMMMSVTRRMRMSPPRVPVTSQNRKGVSQRGPQSSHSENSSVSLTYPANIPAPLFVSARRDAPVVIDAELGKISAYYFESHILCFLSI